MMEIFNALPDAINELVTEFVSIPMVGTLGLGLTQYTFWLIVSSILLLLVMVAYARGSKVVPSGMFQNVMESIVQFVQADIVKSILGDSWRRHFPFLATLFFFILFSNGLGVIPGAKPGTGTISTTAAVAVVVFIYFIACGIRKNGFIGYVKSLAPEGVGFPLNVLVWLIELISTILRPITLAIRLFCNMFAGHVVMGSFAIMVSMFSGPIIHELEILNVFPGIGFSLILLVIYAIEIFVAFVQAYVFTILSAVYIQSAEEGE